jgi:hypothetical protein
MSMPELVIQHAFQAQAASVVYQMHCGRSYIVVCWVRSGDVPDQVKDSFPNALKPPCTSQERQVLITMTFFVPLPQMTVYLKLFERPGYKPLHNELLHMGIHSVHAALHTALLISYTMQPAYTFLQRALYSKVIAMLITSLGWSPPTISLEFVEDKPIALKRSCRPRPSGSYSAK